MQAIASRVRFLETDVGEGVRSPRRSPARKRSPDRRVRTDRHPPRAPQRLIRTGKSNASPCSSASCSERAWLLRRSETGGSVEKASLTPSVETPSTCWPPDSRKASPEASTCKREFGDGIHAARAQENESGTTLPAELEHVDRSEQVVLDELTGARRGRRCRQAHGLAAASIGQSTAGSGSKSLARANVPMCHLHA